MFDAARPQVLHDAKTAAQHYCGREEHCAPAAPFCNELCDLQRWKAGKLQRLLA